MLGGHGDTMVAMLNHTEVNGEPIKNLIKAGKLSQDDLNKIVERTKGWSRDSKASRKGISVLCASSSRNSNG